MEEEIIYGLAHAELAKRQRDRAKYHKTDGGGGYYGEEDEYFPDVW